MIDSIAVSPTVHLMTGTLTLLASILALGMTGWAVWQKRPFTAPIHASFIVFQLALMLQALVGIKLLDQGFGPLQLYIHYVGGWRRWLSASFFTGCPCRATARPKPGGRPLGLDCHLCLY